MAEIIEKLEHEIMFCYATGTMLVHIDKGDAEKVVALLKEQEEEIENLKQTMQSMMEGICLLKEQEAVKPVITPWAENEDSEVVISKQECGRCGYQFFTEKPNYCENCGTPILWEGR